MLRWHSYTRLTLLTLRQKKAVLLYVAEKLWVALPFYIKERKYIFSCAKDYVSLIL